MRWNVVMVALLGFAAAAAQAQPAECSASAQLPGRMLAEGDGFRLLFSIAPANLRVGEHFNLDITVCSRNGGTRGQVLKVDADMPAHRHGMNYRATLHSLGEGRLQAQGLMFHMPGRWRFIFDLSGDQGTTRLTREIEVE